MLEKFFIVTRMRRLSVLETSMKLSPKSLSVVAENVWFIFFEHLGKLEQETVF